MAIDTSQSPARRLAIQLANGTKIGSGRAGATRESVTPASDNVAQSGIALVAKPRRLIRPMSDPLDLDAALARLATLLEMGEPQLDAPRGYYLNILV